MDKTEIINMQNFDPVEMQCKYIYYNYSILLMTSIIITLFYLFQPNTPVEASVMLTLKGDVTEQVRVMLRAFVVSD